MPPKSLTHLEIEFAAPQWRKLRGLKPRLNKAAEAALSHLPKALQPLARASSFTLLLTTDSAVKKLNSDWRGKNKPTNVLSFPQFTPTELKKLKPSKGAKSPKIYLGDIAISYRYVVDEAKKEDKKLLDHATHLMIHGILHIFGYDHATAAQAVQMEKLEKKVMASLGLPDPYAINNHK